MEQSKEFCVKPEITLTVTAEDIDCLLAKAFEGGINYWCDKVEVVGDYLGEYASDQISRGGTLKLFDSESDEVYELDLNGLLGGIQKYIEAGNFGINDGGKLDIYNIDALVADAIVQYALFGDVIYG